MNFLESLSRAQRLAFISVAHERTFVRGATIMQEGELADHVIVILAGWTRITVRENGGERVIAERGPGQLVGERSALQVNVRSATVLALGTVRALVMRTADFASFVDAHPGVLDIVEKQIYDRLTEELAGDEPGEQRQLAGALPGPVRHALRASPSPVRSALPECPQCALQYEPRYDPPRTPLAGENCTVLLTDVLGFGALNRNDQDRLIIRYSSREMIRSCLGRLWGECITEDRGDGLLIVAPPHIPTATLMAPLHRDLADKLRRHNRLYSESVNIRLRVAANVGPVVSDHFGMSGEAIIRTARLNEAPAVKDAMKETGALIGFVTSQFVYDNVIRHAEDPVHATAYSPVEVSVKESNFSGWLWLVDPGRLPSPTG